MKPTRIFVTGATGFIGSHLVQQLVVEGFSVGALRRRPLADPSQRGVERDVTFYTGDIRLYEDVARAIVTFQPDTVIHLVTYYAVMHRPDEVELMTGTNVTGMINLLEASRASGSVCRVINTSSCAVYEQKDCQQKETDPVKPQNLYALTKLQSEMACSFYSDMYSIPSVNLRIFPPYGPGDHERRLIPYVIGCILNNSPPNLTTGRQKWDFVYIDDIVSAYMAVLKKFPQDGGSDTINIGTGDPLSIRSVVERIRTLMRSQIELPWGSVPHRENEVWFNSADIEKARAVIRWKPKTGIEEGLGKTIEWFKQKK